MTVVAGIAVVAALVVLAGAEIRAALLGLARPGRRELIVLAVVFGVGAAAALLRLLVALRVV
jgi:hypothetical protein